MHMCVNELGKKVMKQRNKRLETAVTWGNDSTQGDQEVDNNIISHQKGKLNMFASLDQHQCYDSGKIQSDS